MGCLLAMFAGLFPRFALFILWVARPERIDAVFDTFLLPLLGLIFLPFATLMHPKNGSTDMVDAVLPQRFGHTSDEERDAWVRRLDSPCR